MQGDFNIHLTDSMYIVLLHIDSNNLKAFASEYMKCNSSLHYLQNCCDLQYTEDRYISLCVLWHFVYNALLMLRFSSLFQTRFSKISQTIYVHTCIIVML